MARYSDSKHIKEILKHVLKQNGLNQGIAENSVISSWKEIVGERINKATNKIYISKKIMFVEIRSAIVKNELNMIKTALVKKINQKAGMEIITKIIIK
jgi:predicted nucleic acid-binding Zn ribbon protein